MNRLYKKWTFVLASFFTILMLSSCQKENQEPNIVFILADDMGWFHLSSNGNPAFETPNIDLLAKNGLVFNQAYSSPLCTPTRAALMTGKYPGRLRMTRVGDDYDRGKQDYLSWYHPGARQKEGDRWDELSVDVRVDLPFKEITLAEIARDAGYVTGFFGKWHLGFEEYYPEHHGFDWVFGGDHHSDYFAPWEGERTSTYEASPGEYITQRLAKEAVGFIEKNKDEKFMLCLWNYGIHKPIEGRPDLVDYYDKKLEDQEVFNPVYGAMGHSLDECVGEVIQSLEANDILDNTIVIFMSDNGPVLTENEGKIYDPRVILNRNTDNAELPLNEAGMSIIQNFSCPADTIRVGFCLADSGIAIQETSLNEVILMAEVYDADNPSVPLKKLRIKGNQVKPEKWIYLLIERSVKSENYQLKITRIDNQNENSVLLKSTADNSIPDADLYIGSNIQPGDLYVKCIQSSKEIPGYVRLTSSGPFRGRKIMLYEGGIRVPLIFSWKGTLEENEKIETPVAHVDILPTLAEFMGEKLSHEVDGVSLYDLILNDSPLPDRELHWHYPHYMYSNGGEAIRNNRYKYIEFYVDGRKELYDLLEDPGEKKNLIEEKSEIAEQLKTKMYQWLEDVDASMPSPLNMEEESSD